MTETLYSKLSRLQEKLDSFIGELDTPFNRLRMLFSKSIHKDSIKINNNVEVDFLFYHTTDDYIRDYLIQMVVDASNDLGNPFKIAIGDFLGNNDLRKNVELFIDMKYDPNNYEQDYFYIQISKNVIGHTNISKEIRREVVKAALLYIDYLYGDNYESMNIVMSNILPLYLEGVNNVSYVYKNRHELINLIMSNNPSKKAATSYHLLKINIERLQFDEFLYDDDIRQQALDLFLEIISISRDNTELYKEWIGDISKTIFKKKVSALKTENDINTKTK